MINTTILRIVLPQFITSSFCQF